MADSTIPPDLLAYLAAMEARLVGLINNGNEPVINRLTSLESELKNLGMKVDTAREFGFQVPKLVIDSLEHGLAPRLAGIEARITEMHQETMAAIRELTALVQSKLP